MRDSVEVNRSARPRRSRCSVFSGLVGERTTCACRPRQPHLQVPEGCGSLSGDGLQRMKRDKGIQQEVLSAMAESPCGSFISVSKLSLRAEVGTSYWMDHTSGHRNRNPLFLLYLKKMWKTGNLLGGEENCSPGTWKYVAGTGEIYTLLEGEAHPAPPPADSGRSHAERSPAGH